jgi:hypothetical protein
MALVLKRKIPKIRRTGPRRSRVDGKISKRLKHVWDSPESYEPQI